MADGVNLDFSLLKQPDYLGDYQNAFQVGRQMAQQQGGATAMSPFATEPAGGAQGGPQTARQPSGAMEEMRPVVWPAIGVQGGREMAQQQGGTTAMGRYASDPAGGGIQGATAPQGSMGDRLSAFSDLSLTQKVQASRRVEQLAAVLNGLGGASPNPNVRLSMAQHLAATTGLMDPAKITLDDVTDQGIAAHIASVNSIERALQQDGPQGAFHPGVERIPTASPQIEAAAHDPAAPVAAHQMSDSALKAALGL